MVPPVKEIESAPKLIVEPATRLLCVMPLAEVSVRVPVADKLIVSVPLAMVLAAVKLLWVILALAAVKLPVLVPWMRSVPKVIPPVAALMVL